MPTSLRSLPSTVLSTVVTAAAAHGSQSLTGIGPHLLSAVVAQVTGIVTLGRHHGNQLLLARSAPIPPPVSIQIELSNDCVMLIKSPTDDAQRRVSSKRSGSKGQISGAVPPSPRTISAEDKEDAELRGTVTVTVNELVPELDRLAISFKGILDVDSHSVALGWIRGGEVQMRTLSSAAEPIVRRLCKDNVVLWEANDDELPADSPKKLIPGTYVFPFKIGISKQSPSTVHSKFYSVSYELGAKLYSRSRDPLNPDPISVAGSASVPVIVTRAKVPLPENLRPLSVTSGKSQDGLISYAAEAPLEIFTGRSLAGLQTKTATVKVTLQFLTGQKVHVESLSSVSMVFRQSTAFRFVALKEDLATRNVEKLNAQVVHRIKVGQTATATLSHLRVPVPPRAKNVASILQQQQHKLLSFGIPRAQAGSVSQTLRRSATARRKRGAGEFNVTLEPVPIHGTIKGKARRQRHVVNADQVEDDSNAHEMSDDSKSAFSVSPTSLAEASFIASASADAITFELTVPTEARDSTVAGEFVTTSTLKEVKRSHEILIRVMYEVDGERSGSIRKQRLCEFSIDLEVV